LRNRIKGYQHVTEAMADLAHIERRFLLSVGYGHPAAVGGVSHLHLGKVASDRVMQIAYSAADVFAMPSLQESFGQTAIEAMACGTPVVAFATGGMMDTVKPGVTGMLADVGSTSGLRDAIARLLSDESLRLRMATECRRTAVAEYASEVQATRYANLYRSLISSPET
jgi:glycosyltransferase involved in cell wall biosynthesis